jgi:hypothetical protein
MTISEDRIRHIEDYERLNPGGPQSRLIIELCAALEEERALNRTALEHERAKVASVQAALAEVVIPLEALRLDGLHRPWLAPSIREAIEQATDRAREVLKREV